MGTANGSIRTISKIVPKVINATTHGYIDYAHSAFFFGLALAWRRKNPAAAAAALGTASMILVQSLLTEYPLGVKPVLSFREHGKIDTAFASLSPLIPNLLGFADTPEALVFRINSVVEGTVVGLTDWSSEGSSPQDHHVASYEEASKSPLQTHTATSY